MSKSRRKFLATTSLGLLGAAVARSASAQTVSNLPPGEPPAFGTGPEVGPEVSPATFAEAEKLARVQLTEAERTMAAQSWRRTMASLYERRTGESYRAGPAEFEGLDEQIREAALHGTSFSDPAGRRQITVVQLGSEPIASLALQGRQMPDSVIRGVAKIA